MAFITINTSYPLYDGIPLTFRAPCDSKDADGLLVNGTKYYLRDANAEDITGINRLFATGAYVSVTVDTVNKYAYITNAVTNYGNTFAGEIIETTRTDLGDRWLLCNGDVVPEGAYPKLREVLQYNTSWRRFGQFYGAYTRVKALPIAGQWLLYDLSASSGNYDKTVVVYDNNTEAYTEVTCPVIDTELNYGIFGLTHDGTEYVLGVHTANDSANDYKSGVYLFASSDLTEWRQRYYFQSAIYHNAWDLACDGTAVLVLTQYDVNTSTSVTYNYDLHAVNLTYTSHAERTSISGSDVSDYHLEVYPGGYWMYKSGDETSSYFYKPGTKDIAISPTIALDWGGLAFFSDRYWIVARLADNATYTRYIAVYDMETQTFSYISLYGTIEANKNAYLYGMDYDRNDDVWMLYFAVQASGAADRYYIGYISANANPADIANYTFVRVEALPENIPVGQMANDRTYFREDSTSGRYVKDPNQKYLPTHDGDTLKYIYTG